MEQHTSLFSELGSVIVELQKLVFVTAFDSLFNIIIFILKWKKAFLLRIAGQDNGHTEMSTGWMINATSSIVR